MNTFTDWLLGNAVATAVLALVVFIITRFTRRRPALTHVLWLLVLLKPLTPPLIPLGLIPGREIPPSTTPLTPTTSSTLSPRDLDLMVHSLVGDLVSNSELTDVLSPVSAAEKPVESPTSSGQALPLRTIVMSLLICGAVVVLILAVLRARRFTRILSAARPAPRDLRRRLVVLARRMGLRSVPDLWVVDASIAPMLWGLAGHARIFVPSGLWDVLGDEGIDTLLVHELAHYQRRDPWIRLIETLVSSMAWWHPALWLARRQIHEAEEQCCDAMVLAALPGRGRTYAEALVSCLDFLEGERVTVPPLAAGLSPVAEMKRRVEMIMDARIPGHLSSRTRLGVALAALLILPVLPSWAQQENSGAPEPSALDVSSIEDHGSASAFLGAVSEAFVETLYSRSSAEPKSVSAAPATTCDDLENAITQLEEMADRISSGGMKHEAEHLKSVVLKLKKVAAERTRFTATSEANPNPFTRAGQQPGASSQKAERLNRVIEKASVITNKINEKEIERMEAEMNEHRRRVEVEARKADLEARRADLEASRRFLELAERQRELEQRELEKAQHLQRRVEEENKEEVERSKMHFRRLELQQNQKQAEFKRLKALEEEMLRLREAVEELRREKKSLVEILANPRQSSMTGNSNGSAGWIELKAPTERSAVEYSIPPISTSRSANKLDVSLTPPANPGQGPR